jgi:hypothetical protein
LSTTGEDSNIPDVYKLDKDMFLAGPYCKVRAGRTARLEDELGLGEVGWRKWKQAFFNLRWDNRAGRAAWRHRMDTCINMTLSSSWLYFKNSRKYL